MDRLRMREADAEIARLMNEAKARGSAIFSADRFKIECIGLVSEYVWKVANKPSDEETARRIIARYLQEKR
jgi:hypothetical protein